MKSLGTCVAHEFPEVGKDIGAVPILKALIAKGHKLILWTMRDDHNGQAVPSPEFEGDFDGNYLTDAVNWFKRNGIELYGIQKNPTQDNWTKSPKCYAQLYIDDAALGIPLIYNPLSKGGRPYVDWKKVEEMLKERHII